jgi:alkanesulfonate monooxygenase SsuD/methylene tetrahydromethanopterin reductase-like flavin-dependent oxidoreductase (luciferase family)
MHVYRGFSEAPGYRSLRSLEAGLRTAIGSSSLTTTLSGAQRGWKDYVADGTIIAGSPERVTEQLRDLADELHIGHLMLLMQFGNMPRETAMTNTRLFAEKVMPNLRDIWDDWEDKWWIKPLARQQSPRPVSS